ncbi:MAG: methyltransferase [Chloroflexi bacterium]|nr:methyltransferase [Chloroflexota bacterium]
MDSRELVQRALEFAQPARIPRQLWLLPWATEHYPNMVEMLDQRYPNDIVTSPAFLAAEPRTVGDPYQPGMYVDEWGCAFENKQRGVIGEVKEPLLKHWRQWETIQPPLEWLTVSVGQVNAFCGATDKFVLAGCNPRPFEQLQFIRRTDNLYMDLMDQPEELFKLLARIHNFYLQQLELWASTDVDALTFMDDWGAQRTLLISPDLWRQVFKPLYRDYIDLAHSRGKYAFMHSDGHTAEIIPDLVEMGLDALNTQIFCMDIEDLGRRFAGRLTFWGEIDRQHLLPFGSAGDIVDAVHRARRALYRDGGVIAQCEFGPAARPENVLQVFEAWAEPQCPSSAPC